MQREKGYKRCTFWDGSVAPVIAERDGNEKWKLYISKVLGMGNAECGELLMDNEFDEVIPFNADDGVSHIAVSADKGEKWGLIRLVAGKEPLMLAKWDFAWEWLIEMPDAKSLDKIEEICRMTGLIVRSKTSGAYLYYKDNLLIPENIACPPIEVGHKLVKSSHIKNFSSNDQILLKKRMGFYSDLQSIKSEDAVTWSSFGYLACQEQSKKDEFFKNLLGFLNLRNDTICQIKLWQRVSHPDTLTTIRGPEMDVILLGQEYLLLVECKWTSGVGKNQGIKKDKNQIEIRQEWIDKLGNVLYPNHTILILGVGKTKFHPDILFISWDDLCTLLPHPHQELFKRYLDKKEELYNFLSGAKN
jgi:hypothetical protein